jgi:hypothetical protein
MRIVVPTDLSQSQVPPGVYKARFSSHKIGQSTTGNPMLTFELTILTQGPNADVKTQGRKVFDRISITESSLWRLNLPYRAVVGNDIPPMDCEVDELMNHVVSALTNQEVIVAMSSKVGGDGVTRSEITGYKPVNG